MYNTYIQMEESYSIIARTVTYCFFVSFSFVFNLYLLVPSKVRRLPRNDPLHIRWRLLSVCLSTLVAIRIQPWVLGTFYYSFSSHAYPSVSVFHVGVLYLGPMALSAWNIHSTYPQNNFNPYKSMTTRSSYIQYWLSSIQFHVMTRPFQPNPWIGIRDLIVAPWAEELVFRCCIVPPFLKMLLVVLADNKKNPTVATSSSNHVVISSSIQYCCLLTPLFFGLAHVHHAIVKYQQGGGQPLKFIMAETLFQFIYTSLFGAYTCWVLCCTSSWVDLVIIHS